jgi:penicillin-insensitive murein endopeptidase
VLAASLLITTAAFAQSPQAVSTGDSRDGAIQGDLQLPRRGRGFTVLPATVKRGYSYGTDRLIHLVESLGRHVATQHPGFVLGVGNLSRRGGGDIPQSQSHNSGRDVDIAFPLRNRRDRPVRPRALTRLGPELRSQDGALRLAPEVGWTIVRHLLEAPGVDVAWLFCSAPVRDAILKAGAQRQAPPELLASAQVVLRQPSDSSPHDDHFHLRLHCSPNESEQHGCTDRTPGWPWTHHREILRSNLLRPAPPLPADASTASALEDAGHGALLDAPWEAQIVALIALLGSDRGLHDAILTRLTSLTGSALPTAGLSPAKIHRRWTRWWASNRSRYGLPPSPG